MSDDSNVAAEFLGRTLPFSELPADVLARTAAQCAVDFFPSGSVLLSRGQKAPDDVYVIQSGAVKIFLADDAGVETLADFRGEGGVVGVLSAVRGGPAHLSAAAVEDTFVFRLPAQVFRDLLATQPAMARYFLKNFSESYVAKAFAELRRRRLPPRAESSLPLFAVRVGDAVRRAPVTLPASADIRRAAEVMAEEGVGSILAVDAQGGVAGIVTDKDLRYKVVAQGLNYNWPVSEVMSAPVRTVPAEQDCFEALLSMMKHQIHHLAVEQGGRVTGVITSHDLMVLQGRSPFGLFSEIERERGFDGLYQLAAKVPLVIRPLVEEGARAGSVGRMIALLNEALLDRILSLLQEELGPPPAPFSWLLLGSEGRREQTFRTDQDNALVYKPPEGAAGGAEAAALARDYFLNFGRAAITHLKRCGFPPCPFGIMASEPRCNRSATDWDAFFRRIIAAPEPEQVMEATIFFDMRAGFGFLELGESVKEAACRAAAANEVFLGFMARDCLRARPPLSFFRGFLVEKNGEHKNTLDIKERGILPFVDFARLMALKLGAVESNTLSRLALARDAGLVSTGLHADLSQAFEFLSQVRLVHQLRLMEQGRQPDNHVDPASLSELERRTLKEAFGLVGAMQSLVREEFHLPG
ncbi:putative CBS domain and cyclic nucleotide-regulated nucleotidyltransferase [Desulfovibrio sp. X2]|uniref:putative nucleotidyltransferase substrate binding domain-containing protein n=1 Tax=Desulfovibrio sp. X2 TaxID=941449 RepID=UPI000358CB68|nr:putative nucleotidyltransferase substrate binding domain-containing protein [Desulfovibrio sp. X2]EPR37069.1 putative CBS domain and cyclic nucleotide-regulated nucleotidyltransferase [Desulfovibrio sp. X2]